MTTRAPSLFSRATGPLLCAASLALLTACPDGEGNGESFGTETAGTETDTTVGDEATTTSEDTTDDETTTTTTSADDGPCTSVGCECEGEGSCDPGLVCFEGVCTDALCGDGEVQPGEDCEDGNDVDGDGCDNDCTFTQVNTVAAGANHTCVIIDGGTVRCWGRGDSGQLGYGNINQVGDDEFPSDVGDVVLPGPVLRLSLGGNHSCGIFQDGGLRCWGQNDRGQLGYGNTNNLGDDENLAGLPAVGVPPTIAVQLGAKHTCARVGNGEARCWGFNEQGQLGAASIALQELLPGASIDVGAPTSGLGVGGGHSCVRFVDGGLRCWGLNDSGQLGYGNLNNIGDDEVPSAAGLVSVVPPNLPANTEIVDVALGGNHSCALLGSGDAVCWGLNTSGQLGTGNLNNIGDDEVPSTQLAVDLPGPVAQLALGANHSCAMLVGGEVYCWGDSQVGQLGYGNLNNIGDDESPSAGGAVNLGAAALQIAAGNNHTCALLEDFEVLCWGQNTHSQLGLGTITVGDNETPADTEPVSVL
ncbi:hypothetical protein [Plesiocystis pacifica]|nr:hypothetical protein [Plesiocystis pacifica]